MSAGEIASKVGRIAAGPIRLRALRIVQRPPTLSPGRAIPFEGKDPAELSSPELLAEAEKLLAGDRKVLGLGWLGPSQWDWCMDPGSGYRWPLVPSYRLQYRKANTEIRLCWELNRFHDICTLSMAYYVTRDPRYVQAVRRTVDEWIHANPAGMGPNWVSAMEAAIRIVNITWAAKLTSPSGDADLHGAFAWLISVHVRFVRMWLSTGSSANNHLLIELMGLICAGAYWSSAAGRLGHWTTRYVEELTRQTGPEGMNKEMSSHYHLLVCESAFHVRSALQVTGAEDATLNRLFQSMVNVVDALSLSGGMCAFGDDDGGEIVRIPSKTGRWDQWLTGVALTPWLHGDSSATRGSKNTKLLRVANYDGIVVVSTRVLRVVVDGAAHGLEPLYAHGHDDSGSIYVGIGDYWFVIDPGTYSYFGDSHVRAYFRSALAHNGPRRVDLVQDLHDAFMWDEPPQKPSVKVVFDAAQVVVTIGARTWTRTVTCTETTVAVQDTVQGPRESVVRLTVDPSWRTTKSTTEWFHSIDDDVRVGLEVPRGTVSRIATPFSGTFGAVETLESVLISGVGEIIWTVDARAS